MHTHYRIIIVRATLLCALAGAVVAGSVGAGGPSECHGRVCHPVEEFCSNFIEGCDKCANICESDSHNHNAVTCAKECSAYQKYDPLQAEIHRIRTQQNIILILLVLLLALIAIRYAYKCVRWLRHKRCITLILKKLQPKSSQQHQQQQHQQQQHARHAAHLNGKDIGGTTISNVMAINEIERAPSQIYSVTGAEGSVMTVTTPVSTRYPAENSTTPTTIPAEYSYDNQALAVTPVSEKPSGAQVF